VSQFFLHKGLFRRSGQVIVYQHGSFSRDPPGERVRAPAKRPRPRSPGGSRL